MYERFTDRARRVMQLANQEAQRFNHEYIGTEHILLGLIKEGSGVAASVLRICPNTEVETVGEDIAAAIQKADRAAGEEDVIIVFGSLSFLYDAQEAVEAIHNPGK